MRNILNNLVLISALLLAHFALAQPDTVWSCRVSAATGAVLYGATELSNGDFVVVGATGPGSGNTGFIVAKLSSGGVVRWTRTFGSTDTREAYAAVEIADSSIVIVGWGTSGRSVLVLGISSAGDSLWSRVYSSSGQTKGFDAVKTRDGNIAIVGYGLGQDYQHSDLWLLKFSSTLHDTLWSQRYGSSNSDIGSKIIERPDGSLALGGYTLQDNVANWDMWLLRTDSIGNQLSSNYFGTLGSAEISYGLSQTDSNLFVCGRSNAPGANAGYVVKTNAVGDSVWIRTYENMHGESQFRGVAGRRNGGALCAGWSGTGLSSLQCWLAALDSHGAIEDSWLFGGVGSELFGLIPVAIGGYLAYGQITVGTQRTGYALRLQALPGVGGTVREIGSGHPVPGVHVGVIGAPDLTVSDEQGRYMIELMPGDYDVVAWGPCVSSDTIFSVTALPHQTVTANPEVGLPHHQRIQSSLNLVVYNRVQSPATLLLANTGTGPMHFRIVPETVAPRLAWMSVSPATGYVEPGDTLGVAVYVFPDTTNDNVYDFDGFLHVHTNSCPDSVQDIYVMVGVLDVDKPSTPLPRECTLSAYPNPFNPLTTLAFSLPQAGVVTLAVYDVTGREVARLADHALSAGEYHLSFDASALPSGIYFARLNTGDVMLMRKLLLVK